MQSTIRWRARNIGVRLARSLVMLGALAAALFVVASPAQADAGGRLVDAQTHLCLDSNWDGAVYTLGCNGGSYQVWMGTDVHSLYDRATGRCLDTNWGGEVYTLGCNGGDYQKWDFQLTGVLGGGRYINRVTGKCLDSNGSGAVYALWCNGGNYQNWTR